MHIISMYNDGITYIKKKKITYLLAEGKRVSPFEGTVSRELRHRLLYIIRKLFSRPIIALHKILILLKGHFTIIKKSFSVS